MAIKKFLMEGQKQVWPITRADCVYTVAGDKLLNVAIEEQHAAMQKAINDEIARAKAAEKEIADELAKQMDAEEEGSLANKIAANDAAIKKEVQDRADAVKGVQDQLDALKGDGEGSVADQIKDLKENLEGQIDDVEQALADEKNAQKDGSLAKQIADEAARAAGEEARIEGLFNAEKERVAEVEADFEERIAANEAFVAAQPAKDLAQDNRLADLEAKFAGDNSVDAKIAAAEAAAKQHAENKDAALKEELEGKIDAKVAQADYDVKMTALDAEDADIRADFAAADQALQANIDKKVDQSAYDTKVAELVAEDGKIRGEFAAADATNLQAAKDYADAQDLADRNAQKLVDDAQDERIKALEDANKDGGAVANAIKAVQDNLDAFEQAQGVKDAAQDKAISDEAARADAAEKANKKAIEDEAAAARAAEEQLGKDIAAEAQRADAAEKANAQAIANEKSRAEGKEGELAQAIADEEERAMAAEAKALKDAKDYADDAIADAFADADVPGQIQEAVSGMEAAVAGEKSAREAADQVLQTNINNEATARENADNALDARLDVIEGEGEGSVKKALADAKAYADEKINEVNGAAEDLEERVKANEDALKIVNGNAEQAGSIAEAKAAADAVQAEMNAFKAAAELGDAAVDTLKEIQDYIVNDGAAADQMVKDIAAAQKAADDEAARAKAEEADIRADFAAADAQVLADAKADAANKVAAEAEIARAAEKANADAIKALDDKIAAGLYTVDAEGGQEYGDLAPLA